jgi:alpha-1,2-mannosyltransferase
LAAVSCIGWLVVQFAFHPHLLDLAVYRAEGFAVVHHIGLYGPIGAPYDLRATYPPFAALMFVPLTLLPLGLCQVLVSTLNLGLIAVAARLTATMLTRDGLRVPPPIVPVVVAAGIWLEPVSTSLHYGQINLLILVLVLGDFARADGARGRGVALGLATALKVTPAFFVVYLVLTRRFRFATTAVATFALSVVGSAVLLPGTTLRFWTSTLFETSRVGDAMSSQNQSLHGFLTRLVDRPDVGTLGLVVTVAATVFGLACSVVGFRRRGEIWGVCAAAVTALLISPISWSHHWVWCVPVAVLFATVAHEVDMPQRVWLALPFAAFYAYGDVSSPLKHSQDPDLTARHQLAAGLYPLAGVAFLILVVSRWNRRPEADATAGGDSMSEELPRSGRTP